MNRFFLCVAILSPCSVFGRRDSPSLYDISLRLATRTLSELVSSGDRSFFQLFAQRSLRYVLSPPRHS
jgi:hypothetical protein